jgi:hypothetical protein
MTRFLLPTIHGVCRLPRGYCFIPVGKGAQFANDPEDDPASVGRRLLSGLTSAFRPRRTDRPVIACDYNVIKILVTIAQLAFALVTLYRTRGDQITMYGYAAFGLTVAQYAWMSLLNLIGSLVCPNYSSIFVVDSKTLKDLRARIEAAGETATYPLSGTIGELTGPAEEETLRNFKIERLVGDAVVMMFGHSLGAVPVAIIGGLSKFSIGGSALYQRVWTMIWLVFGFVLGPGLSVTIETGLNYTAMHSVHEALVLPLWFFFSVGFVVLCNYAAPAVGGFVVVGQMILDYGVCIRLST